MGVAAEAVGADEVVVAVASGTELVCATGSSTAAAATVVSLTLEYFLA